MSYPLTNVLIDSLEDADRKRLLERMRHISLPLNASFYEAGEGPKYIHFLTSGMASIVTTMNNGETTEVGTLGREGVPEGLHLLGPVTSWSRCFMQIAGTGFRMDFHEFRQIFENNPAIRKIMLAQAQYQSVLLAQVAGCNRLHEVEGRLARWLLMAQDRTGAPVLALTQEFLAEMMGSRRTSVTTVASKLQGMGLLSYVRGRVRILDRPGLEKKACECYQHTRDFLSEIYALANQSIIDPTVNPSIDPSELPSTATSRAAFTAREEVA